MELLSGGEIRARFKERGSRALSIDPLLEDSQVGDVTVDFRLGYDFQVSVMTRKPFLNVDPGGDGFRSLASYFHTTRRDIGDTFLLYPGQVALATTLEYVAMPDDCYLDLMARSSYARLGMPINVMVQPGYRGCIGVQLFNHGNNPLELVVGSRVFQARFFTLANARTHVGAGDRKYLGNVRPAVSRANEDPDLALLTKIRSNRR